MSASNHRAAWGTLGRSRPPGKSGSRQGHKAAKPQPKPETHAEDAEVADKSVFPLRPPRPPRETIGEQANRHKWAPESSRKCGILQHSSATDAMESDRGVL